MFPYVRQDQSTSESAPDHFAAVCAHIVSYCNTSGGCKIAEIVDTATEPD